MIFLSRGTERTEKTECTEDKEFFSFHVCLLFNDTYCFFNMPRNAMCAGMSPVRTLHFFFPAGSKQ